MTKNLDSCVTAEWVSLGLRESCNERSLAMGSPPIWTTLDILRPTTTGSMPLPPLMDSISSVVRFNSSRPVAICLDSVSNWDSNWLFRVSVRSKVCWISARRSSKAFRLSFWKFVVFTSCGKGNRLGGPNRSESAFPISTSTWRRSRSTAVRSSIILAMLCSRFLLSLPKVS